MADKPSGIAFDKASARSFDKDGRLHISRTHISKANVCPYLGREVPGWESLGLQADKVYKLYREAASLEKGASTFNRLPLLRKHIQVSAADPKKDDVIGALGSDVAFEAPYLDASLTVWDAEAIAMIESGALEELSSAYHYTPVMTAGTTPDGEAYDGLMTDIIGNHLAIVEQGRAGPDVLVADSMPIELISNGGSEVKSVSTAPHKEANAMKKTKLGKALFAVLSAASPKIAQDSALLGLVGDADRKTLNAKELAKQLVAMDADLDEGKTEAVIDSVVDLEEVPTPQEPAAPVKDDGEEIDVLEFLKGKLSEEDFARVAGKLEKPALDSEEVVEKKVDEAVKIAADSMMARFKDLETAKYAVRSVVGDVVAMDSAEQVYRFALDHMKVDNKGIAADGLPAVFAAVQAAKNPAPVSRVKVAMDSKSVTEDFDLSRFTRR